MTWLKRNSITIRDLVVVNFWNKLLSPEIRAWKAERPVATAMSCTRQIWYGDRQTFEDFPALSTGPLGDRSRINKVEGPDAYRFLLNLITGLESKSEGETNIAGQFFSSFRPFREQHPEQADRFETLLQHIRADARLIRGQYLSSMKPRNHAIAARNVSGQKASENVLVIGSLNNSGILGEKTAGILKVLGNNRSARASSIILTNPVSAALETLAKETFNLAAKGVIKSSVEIAPFSRLSRLFEECARVYVDLPMGASPDTDSMIIDAWKNHVRPDNTLTHLRGEPLKKGLSNEQWMNSNLRNYKPVEAIYDELNAIAGQNNNLRAKAANAIDACVEHRISGKAPSRYVLRQNNDIPLLAVA